MRRLIPILTAVLVAIAPLPSLAQTYEAPEVVRSRDKVRVSGKVYWSHVVTQKQTLWSISKAYEVSVEDIIEANPTLDLASEGLKAGQILMIPVRKSGKNVQDSKNQSEDKKIAVQDKKDKAEDKKTQPEDKKVDAADLFKSIFGKTAGRDTVRQAAADSSAIAAAPADSMVAAGNGVAAEDSLFIEDIPARLDISVILPLEEGQGEGLTEFYSGVLLAVRDLGLRGNKIDLTLCSPTDTVSAPWRHSDVIVGPVNPSDIEKTLRHTPYPKYLISPLDPRASRLAEDNRIVQAPSSWNNQLEELVAWAAEETQPGDSIIVVLEKDVPVSQPSRFLLDELKKAGLSTKTITYGILEGLTVSETFVNLASKEGTTRYFIASENEAFVGDVIRNVNLMAYKGYKVTAYYPSRIRSFELIDVESFHNISLRMTASYFTDYTSPEVKSFVMAYRALFNAEPGSYAFQGYDTTTYFATACARYGRHWFRKLPECRWRGLQTDFRFDVAPTRGQVNKAVRRVIFQPDYSIVLQ